MASSSSSSSYMPLRRSDSVADMMPEALRQSRYQMKRCFQRYVSKGRRLMKNQQLMEELETSTGDDKVEKARLAEGFLGYVICSTQEAVVLPSLVAFAVRTNPGVWEFIRVHSGDLSVEQIKPTDYLKCKEPVSRFMSSKRGWRRGGRAQQGEVQRRGRNEVEGSLWGSSAVRSSRGPAISSESPVVRSKCVPGGG